MKVDMEKGTLGYIDSYKKRYGLYIAGLALAIVISALVVYFIFGTLKHIAVLIPVILALPFAKILVLWLIVAKFHSMDTEEGTLIQERLENRRNCTLLFDMALSAYEAVSFASCLIIDQGNIYLLWGGSNDKKFSQEQQRDYVQDIVRKTGYQDFQVFTYTDLNELIEDIEAAPVADGDLSVQCDRLKQRMLDVCV